jgi:hypothetical protein
MVTGPISLVHNPRVLFVWRNGIGGPSRAPAGLRCAEAEPGSSDTRPGLGRAPDVGPVTDSRSQATRPASEVSALVNPIRRPDFHVNGPADPVSVPAGQLNGPVGQVSKFAFHVSGPVGQVRVPAGQVCVPAGQVCVPAGQVCVPAGQVSVLAGQVSGPVGQISGPGLHASGPTGQVSIPAGPRTERPGRVTKSWGRTTGPGLAESPKSWQALEIRSAATAFSGPMPANRWPIKRDQGRMARLRNRRQPSTASPRRSAVSPIGESVGISAGGCGSPSAHPDTARVYSH